MAVNPLHIDIQMEREELTKTFMMISNWKKTWFTYQYFSNERVGDGKVRTLEYGDK